MYDQILLLTVLMTLAETFVCWKAQDGQDQSQMISVFCIFSSFLHIDTVHYLTAFIIPHFLLLFRRLFMDASLYLFDETDLNGGISLVIGVVKVNLLHLLKFQII